MYVCPKKGHSQKMYAALRVKYMKSSVELCTNFLNRVNLKKICEILNLNLY